MPETTRETPASKLTPDLVQGIGAKMDIPRPDFSHAPETPQQTKEEMAEQVRRLIMYVGQEGDENDLEDWVRGLDDDKLVAFAERYRENLPFEVLAFLYDTRKRVNGQMPALPQDSDIFMSDWIKNYMKAHGLKEGDIVSQGRDAVMEVLAVAFDRNGNLTKSERRGVRNMAQNITDEKIIRHVMDYAAGHSYVVMCLLRNPNFDLDYVYQLVDKVVTSHQGGENAEECKGILVEVSGHLARSLDGMVLARSKSNNEDGSMALEFVPKIVSLLDQVDGANLFSAQIRRALDALKDPNALQDYAKNLTKVDIPSATEIPGNGKNGKIRAQNAEKAASVNGAKNGGVFPTRSRRLTPVANAVAAAVKPAVAKPVHSGGSNKAKKTARIAAAKAKAAAKRKRK